MAARKPNIVYIFADDMGYGDVSWLNRESKIHTRHIDRIGAEGMAFTDAHASSAVCTPSRYSVLTGRYNWRSERKYGVTGGYSKPLLEAGRMTVASMLKEQGYATACIGKWHLGLDWPTNSDDETDVDYTAPLRDGPTHRGFDRFFGISASLDMPPYVYIDDDRVTAVPDRDTAESGMKTWRPGPTGADFRHEEVLPKLTDEAVRFVHENAAQPFFLYFPLPAPHTPILPLPEFQGASGTNPYGDFCLQVDHTVGQVMKALEEQGLEDDTILIFTTDNGCSPEADFRHLAAMGHHPSYHFRGCKADIYEGGHRVPFLVRWPREVPAGTFCHETVCLSDLMATLAEIVGKELPPDAGEDSVSNLPLWRDPRHGAVREATVHHSVQGYFSIRRGRWKLEMCPGSGGWSYPQPDHEPSDAPAIQLYDLDADVSERRNVQDEHPEVVRELTDLLTRYVKDGRSTPGPPQQNTGPRHWPQLNWLHERDL
jgi:arylsulfatase A-like enzyme